MIKIGLISDTHSHMDDAILEAFKSCDEIWHAGDIGDHDVMKQLEGIAPLRAVYGNIDDHLARRSYPKDQLFEVEGLSVFMTHIGGYPPRYTTYVRDVIDREKPDLYICGHSHILKVMPDKKRQILHMNPGAAGHHGFHKIRTVLRFAINKGKIEQVEVVELGFRGRGLTLDDH